MFSNKPKIHRLNITNIFISAGEWLVQLPIAKTLHVEHINHILANPFIFEKYMS